MEETQFDLQNQERIHAVESTFGRPGKLFQKPGRILVGEGRLLKMCRRGPRSRMFYLFNDILAYGSIVVPGHWNSRLQIISLEDVQLEGLEDGAHMANQWLVRTPRKSFYVGAASPEEKVAWMEHIQRFKKMHLSSTGILPEASGAGLAAAWIPDTASAICMRCSERFGPARRRHHCRRCGYIVCSLCSKSRALLPNIHPKPVRICRQCSVLVDEHNPPAKKVKSKIWKKNSVEDQSSDEEQVDQDDYMVPTKWFGAQQTEPMYCYIKPEHMKPPVSVL